MQEYIDIVNTISDFFGGNIGIWFKPFSVATLVVLYKLTIPRQKEGS